MIGTNDLAAGTPAAEVVANVRKIVERFQSESPRTKFYVQSVFPVNDSFKKYAAKHGRHDADIVAVNKGLQALCAEKGIVYIDLWTLLALPFTLFRAYSTHCTRSTGSPAGSGLGSKSE